MDNLVERFFQLYDEGQLSEAVSIGKWLTHIYRDSTDIETKAAIFYNLGTLYLEIGEYREAVDSLNEATNLLNTSDKGESYIDALLNLAIARHKSGEREKAIYLQNVAINLIDKNYGFKGEEATDARYNLANFYFDGRDFTEAIAAHLRVLERRENRTDEMIDSLLSLAYAYEKKADYTMALSYIKKALKQIEEIYGEEDLDYIATLFYKAKILEKLDEEEKALIYGQKVLRLTRDNPSFIPFEIEVLDWLSDLSYDYGMLDRAIHYKQASVESFRQYSSDYHLVLANGYNRLAQLFIEKNDLKKVSYYLGKGLEMKEHLLGITHLNYIKDVLTAVVFWIENKEFATAYRYIDEVFIAFEEDDSLDKTRETEMFLNILKMFDTLDPEEVEDFNVRLSSMMDELEDMRSYFDKE